MNEPQQKLDKTWKLWPGNYYQNLPKIPTEEVL